MKAVLPVEQATSLGSKVRKLRIGQMLTQEGLARRAGVLPGEVEYFEGGMPVRLDAKRRILKVLWAKKGGSDTILLENLNR